MSTKHTPGPWRIAGTQQGLFVAGDKPGYLAEIRDCGSGDVAANARLVAAAPELLTALREIIEQTSYTGFGDPVSRATYVESVARAAIAKAEGQ